MTLPETFWELDSKGIFFFFFFARFVVVTEGEGLNPIRATHFDLGLYILCRCLGFDIMDLKAAINKIVFLAMDVGCIGRTT